MPVLDRTEFKTVDLKPRIGAEIIADKETLLSGKYAGEIRDALEARGVLLFREINFVDSEQVAFTKTLGVGADEGEGGIFKVTMDKKANLQADYLKGAFFWHFDGFTSKKPIRASLLSARVLAPEGGDTEFCNTYAAYDDLSDEDKALCDNLQVIHTFEATQRYFNPEMSHADLKMWQEMGKFKLPLVWKHASGRKSLLLGNSAAWIEGMDLFESMDLLVRLREWATKPEYVYRHKWTVGDLVIWDNTGTLHRAMEYALDSGRMMHRTKLEGEEAIA